MVTSEYLLRGYRVRDLRRAWALLPWTPERQAVLGRLRVIAQRKVHVEGVDVHSEEFVERAARAREEGERAQLAAQKRERIYVEAQDFLQNHIECLLPRTGQHGSCCICAARDTMRVSQRRSI